MTAAHTDVDDLIQAAREVADEFGRVPGRLELMRLLGIDAPTADVVLGELFRRAR